VYQQLIFNIQNPLDGCVLLFGTGGQQNVGFCLVFQWYATFADSIMVINIGNHQCFVVMIE
jgi:hypothetical protein